ncbi:VOC family protein [Methylobacterium oryzae]|uniref:Glyoxalase n=1 Tax=Methylobacterium oryzae TaxID=334852 RepID=A0ABU7TUJ8_9HYPH
MTTLSYVNIFARQLEPLAAFYSGLLGLEEIVDSRSSIFRGFRCGDASLGISASDAYELLGLRQPTGEGERNIVTFDVESPTEVERLVEAAKGLGAEVVKEPFETYYGWYQAVLRDPEGNPFRLNHPGRRV